jgi:hypothetical protein
MEQCFALERNNRGKLACKATTNSCNGMDRKCPFFKTLTDMLFDREESMKRIATLPYWQQQEIAKKHYKGEMPWRKYAEEYAGTGGSEA